MSEQNSNVFDPKTKLAALAKRAKVHDFDMLIGMDEANIRNMRRMCGAEDKISMLLDYTDMPGSVADPWFTGDFETTWRDVERGCKGLLNSILAAKQK